MWTDLVLCYLHIPKSGGTSIRDVFSNAVPDGSVFDCYWALSGHTIEDLLWLSTAEKRAIRVLFGHYFFGTHTILERPATYATILRDPVDRVVSQYRYQSMTNGLPFVSADRAPTFDEMLTSGNFAYNNLTCRMIAGIGPRRCTDNEVLLAAKILIVISLLLAF